MSAAGRLGARAGRALGVCESEGRLVGESPVRREVNAAVAAPHLDAVHAVSIGADLAKGSTARRKAEQVDPARITSLERRSRLLIETARAYQLQRDWAGSLMFLRQAYQVSPEAVKYQPIARRIVTDAVDGKVPLVQREATEFAQLLGIMV